MVCIFAAYADQYGGQMTLQPSLVHLACQEGYQIGQHHVADDVDDDDDAGGSSAEVYDGLSTAHGDCVQH